MAEEVRFELTEPVKVQRFSRPPHSTTLPPLRDKSSLALATVRSCKQQYRCRQRSGVNEGGANLTYNYPIGTNNGKVSSMYNAVSGETVT
jgi:hypothetical protein